MSDSDWEDWLRRWWRAQWDMRNADPPACQICDMPDDLVMVRRTPAGPPMIYEDVIALCQRCATRTLQLVAERSLPGSRWAGMPREIAIDTAVYELTAGTTPLEPDSGE
ncbi:hypothetical protein [Nakamurella lactea]|uniref:hypothetical protein n=1 Tax=Nakamurella lactea TaxID=459515 RepID=UPI00041ACEF6|nr:hypothetical protein [Nakamurella lactea]